MQAITPARIARTDPRPSPLWLRGLGAATSAWFGLAPRVELRIDGPIPTGDRPVVYAPNHTHALDFLPLRYALYRRGQRLVTWIKPRAYADRLSALVFARTGNIPVASRGYVIASDLRAVLGRRPSEDEYRAVRDHVDGRAPLPRALAELATAPRALAGRSFDPTRERYPEAVHASFAALMNATLTVSRRALAAGLSLHVFPQGTVQPRLTPARTGVIQAAHALGTVIVPVGISGAPAALGGGARRAGGTIRLRFGAPYRPPRLPRLRAFGADSERVHRAALDAAAAELTARIDALLDPAHRLDPAADTAPTAVARFV